MITVSNQNELNWYKNKPDSYYVYALHFADKIYIGATTQLFTRLTVHLQSMNNIINGRPHNLFNTYIKAIEYLKANNLTEISFSLFGEYEERTIAYLNEALLLNTYHKKGILINTNIPNQKYLDKLFSQL